MSPPTSASPCWSTAGVKSAAAPASPGQIQGAVVGNASCSLGHRRMEKTQRTGVGCGKSVLARPQLGGSPFRCCDTESNSMPPKGQCHLCPMQFNTASLTKSCCSVATKKDLGAPCLGCIILTSIWLLLSPCLFNDSSSYHPVLILPRDTGGNALGLEKG